MDDYKTKLTESFNAINVFNGGISGFITRAQEAGGALPLLKNSFKGISEGIGGMTKSALTFIATPLGAIIAALALALKAVSTYFTDTQEGMDQLNAVTRPLKAVMEALMDVLGNLGKALVAAFNDPKKAIEDFVTMIKDNVINRFNGLLELIPNLSKAISLLFEGKFSEAAKVATDAVAKVSLGVENITDKVIDATEKTGAFLDAAWQKGQKIDTLQKKLDKGLAEYTKHNAELGVALDKQNSIAADTNQTFANREAAAQQSIDTLKAQNKLVLDRLKDEIELFKLKSKGTDAEKAELAEMEARQLEMQASQAAGEKQLQDRLNDIRQEAHDKENERRKQALDAALQHQKQLLDLYITENTGVEKTLAEQIKFQEEKAKKSIAILQEELRQKKISQLEYDNLSKQAEAEKTASILKLNTDYGSAMIALYKQKNQALLKNDVVADKATIEAEKTRLRTINDMNLRQLEQQSGLKEANVNENNAAESAEKAAFYTEILRLRQELATQMAEIDAGQLAANQKNDADKIAKKHKDAEDSIAEMQVQKELADTEYEQQLIEEDIRQAEKKEKADKWLEQNKISQQEYTDYVNKLETETAKNKQKLALQNAQTQLGTMQSVATALGDAFGQSKELAIAQATMSAGQAILGIWAGTITQNPVVDAIIKSALTASTAVKTGKQIKEIASAKKPKQPKFEKGGLVTIGGQRHSAGGTLFTGADGTRFEAEQGELIGVMNRNAAQHFMAFNNAFSSGGGSRPNYFASGGIVSREVAQQAINTDELAAKIALANSTLPAPVVAVQDIITQGSSYVKVKEGANF